MVIVLRNGVVKFGLLVQDLQIERSVKVMSDNVEHVDFPFAAARRITSEEVAVAKLAVKEQFGIEPGKRGRPPKLGDQKYEAVSIRLNPQVLLWARAEGDYRSGRLR